MSTVEQAQTKVDVSELFDRRTWAQRAANMARKQPLGVFGAAVVVIMVFMAIFAPWLTPYNPEANSFEYMLVPPSADFWLGTDQFGRDLLTARRCSSARWPHRSARSAASSSAWAAPISAARST